MALLKLKKEGYKMKNDNYYIKLTDKKEILTKIEILKNILFVVSQIICGIILFALMYAMTILCGAII